MGHMRAMEAATTMTDMAGLERALEYHLTANHFPPVPRSMVQPSIKAIEAVVNEEPETMVELPEGISYQGEPSAPAYAIVEQHHLGAFVAAQIEESEGEDMTLGEQAHAESEAREALRVAYDAGYGRQDLHDLVDDIVDAVTEEVAAETYSTE